MSRSGGPRRWVAAPLALLLSACTADPAPAPGGPPADGTVPAPFAGCAALAAPPSAAPAGRGAADLPDVELPCFTGGPPVRLTALRGPLLLNLWGSWCGPCRAELPAVQRLADRTAGRLHVVTVDTQDSRDDAARFATRAGVRLPTLYDPDRRLAAALGRPALPLTVVVDAAGRRYVHTGPGLDDAALAALARDRAGVAVDR